ncbi:hypothetical protein [Legionella sp.]|uniref:hypothetical protein n=1 Tax=Legionella sp. TaxID=459 RepID=UPI0032207188
MKQFKKQLLEVELKKAGPLKQFIGRISFVLELILAGTLKDIKDTFKPYKSSSHVSRDLVMQPVYGIAHIATGAMLLLVSPLLFLGGALALPFTPRTAVDALKTAGLSFVAGSTMAVRGATQILAWPLSILRTPIRGLITWFKGSPKVEDSEGIRKLIGQYQETNESHDELLNNTILVKTLIIKAQKGLKSQKSVIPQDDYLKCFSGFGGFDGRNEMSKVGNREVITFFKNAIEKRDREIAQENLMKRMG